MARPKAVRTNLGKVALLSNVQRDRLETLRGFARFLVTEEVRLGAFEDDELFSSTIRLAVTDYGVRQVSLADRLGVTSPAVSRWMNGAALPQPYGREGVLRAIAEIIHENIAQQDAMASHVLRTGSVSAFAN